MLKPIKELRVVDGFCVDGCLSVHWTCPCGNKTSVSADIVTDIFSATCEQTNELYLIDWRFDEDGDEEKGCQGATNSDAENKALGKAVEN